LETLAGVFEEIKFLLAFNIGVVYNTFIFKPIDLSTFVALRSWYLIVAVELNGLG